ncbi:MAG: ATP synthase F1 subunit delta [Ignavibacteriales bacterium]|nr:ATP synthase F1 subunit delta [Ignavibacteriales bacterium]
MNDSTLTTRYAKAILDESLSRKNLDKIEKDVNFVDNVFRTSKEFKAFYLSPTLRKEKKIEVVTIILSQIISKETLNLLLLLIKKNREKYIILIINRIKELKNEMLGYSNVLVRSSIPLSDKQKIEVNQLIKKFTKQKIEVDYTQDKNLIGGFIIQIGDKIIDASLKNQFNKLKKKLIVQN